MAKKYEITKEQKEEIEAARKRNRNKRTEAKLKVLVLRAEGKTANEIHQKTGYHPAYVSTLVSKYIHGGLEAMTGNHYKGNRRNIQAEEEAELLRPFEEKAEKGQIVETSKIKEEYEKRVGHKIGSGQIYRVLKRQGWRKVMPRSRHPKKAGEEEIESSKKLTIL